MLPLDTSQCPEVVKKEKSRGDGATCARCEHRDSSCYGEDAVLRGIYIDYGASVKGFGRF